VCHRWRRVVFASPRRLNLQLLCLAGTHARDTLDVWPALPLIIEEGRIPSPGIDNIVAVLERSDRVHQIILTVSNSDFEKVLPAMLVPFPELTILQFRLDGISTPVLQVPDLFLGGSAPRLKSFSLNRILFPGLPKLHLSAPHLVRLSFDHIPYSGFMSPESMTAVLSTLTSLEYFHLNFQFRSRSDQASRRSPPPTRFVLHALTSFWFEGVREYLEDVLARIDAPRLESMFICFDKIGFDTPQFIGFISRTPSLKAPKKARIDLRGDGVMVTLSPRIFAFSDLSVKFLCGDWGRPPSFLVQICTSYLPPLSTLEDLYINDSYPPPWLDDITNSQWLEALHPFSAVKNLYLSEEFAQRIVPALQEPVGGRTTEVLPTLEKIIFKGPKPSGSVQEAVEQFVAARQSSAVNSLPIAIIHHRDHPY
jgi:hypothetical protein